MRISKYVSVGLPVTQGHLLEPLRLEISVIHLLQLPLIEFYNRGGNPNPYLDPELCPLHLAAEEKKSLLAFLRALSGTVQEGCGSR